MHCLKIKEILLTAFVWNCSYNYTYRAHFLLFCLDLLLVKSSLRNSFLFLKYKCFALQVGGNDKTYLRVTEVKLESPKNLQAWRVDLKKPLAAGSEQTVQVDVYLAKAFQLYPEEITQREKQMVKHDKQQKLSKIQGGI